MSKQSNAGPKPVNALTVDQAAEQLQVSPKTVRRLIDQAKLPHHRVGVGRRILRISQEALSAFYWQRLEAGVLCPSKSL